MNIKDFQAGNLVQRFRYKSFSPNKVNIAWNIDDPTLSLLLSQADIKLGELNAFSQLIPDVDFFIKMHIAKEGSQSSRIEGTQTNIDEVLQKIEYIQPEKRDDWEEVHNYIRAMNEAIANLAKLPISTRLIRNTHLELLQGVRGKYKQPGEFRNSQNWIGGSSLNDATFIPPHQDEINDLMNDLEQFLHNENDPVPPLIKIGIAHYQFETIHPFLDGNGRIGRLLIPLYLIDKGLLSKPTLYISDFFEHHRTLYYDNLNRVRTHSDLTQWLKFFLEGIKQTAENSIETFKQIIKLRQNCEHKIISLGNKIVKGKELLNHLYSNPIIDSQDVAQLLQVSHSTALRLIEDFIRFEILIEITGYKRNRIFAFDAYLLLFREK